MPKKFIVIATVFFVVLAMSLLQLNRSRAADVKEDPAVERTRRQVRMLDDVYKTAVVLITKHYVKEDSDLPAGTKCGCSMPRVNRWKT